MSDLFQGRTMTELYKLVSGGAAYTISFNFQPDKVVFYNLTQWDSTAGHLPISIWWRGENAAAEAFQQQVIDSAAAQSFNFLDTTTNGFTVADTSGGVAESVFAISGVTQADPCVVTTSSAHGFQDDQLVRITDLGQVGANATDRGMDELNNNRYRITVTSTTEFSLKDPITDEAIDSSSFVAYVSGGNVTLITHVKQLNNPQVSPYSSSSPYNPNEFAYDPVTYKLTAGTSVMGSDGDEFVVEVYKFGQVSDLGDIG